MGSALSGQRRFRFLVAAILLFAAALGVALLLFSPPPRPPSPVAAVAAATPLPTIGALVARFSTADANSPAEAGGPVHVDVTGNQSAARSSSIGLALQLRDAAGRPALLGDTPASPVWMYIPDSRVGWSLDLTAPTVPGRYHIHLTLRMAGQPDREFELNLPILDVVPDAVYPGGLVFSRSGNLWRSDSLGGHLHQVTFLRDGRAQDPAWAPNSAQIAYTRSLPAAASDIPRTEIWALDPAGGADKPLAVRRADEDLLLPAFGPDGALYFTAARIVDPGTGATPTANRIAAAVESWSIFTLDLSGAQGTRQLMVPAARMPDLSRDGRYLVYLAAPDAPAAGVQPAAQSLVVSDGDGRAPRALIPSGMFQAVYAPRLSPDGSQVAFAAVNPTGVPGGLNLLQQFGLESRPAFANGVPWDLYLVSTSGGRPTRLTYRNTDMPFPAWSRDGTRLAFLDPQGLYILDLAHPQDLPPPIGPGSSHGQLSWAQP